MPVQGHVFKKILAVKTKTRKVLILKNVFVVSAWTEGIVTRHALEYKSYIWLFPVHLCDILKIIFKSSIS